MNTIVLNDYEVANLKALIESCGYGLPNRVDRNPLWVANTGDWLGQIYQKLPTVHCDPNASPDELAKRANEFK